MEEVGDFQRSRHHGRIAAPYEGQLAIIFLLPASGPGARHAGVGPGSHLQGQTRERTVYFSDIAGDIDRRVHASRTTGAVTEPLFDEMTQVVAEQGGTVDKFIADPIMAFWGAFATTADHAARACE